jgi:hypothetical protein
MPLSTEDIYNLALKQTAIQLATTESPGYNVPKSIQLSSVEYKGDDLLDRLTQSIPYFSTVS